MALTVKLFANDIHLATSRAGKSDVVAFPIFFWAKFLWVQFFGFHLESPILSTFITLAPRLLILVDFNIYYVPDIKLLLGLAIFSVEYHQTF
jgi:hypothetical protein